MGKLILYNNTAENNICEIISKGGVPTTHIVCNAKVMENNLITSEKSEENSTLSLKLNFNVKDTFSTFNANKSKYNNRDFDEFVANLGKNVEVYVRQSYVAAVRIDNTRK